MTIFRLGLIGVVMLIAGIGVGRYAPAPRDHASRPDDAPAARRWEATVYLPLADNAGRPFSDGEWEEALAAFAVPFGGATLGTPQEGCWLDPRGRVHREPVRPVVVSFAPGRLDEFRAAARAVGRLLGQEAIYVRFEEPRVELIPGGGD
jgi:hypothetical protein